MSQELQVGRVFLRLTDGIEDEMEKIKSDAYKLFFRAKEPIINYGESVDYLYYLAKGRVKIVNINDFAQERTFSYIDAGFFLCEPLFFTKSISSGVVTATESCEVWRFTDYEVKNALFAKHPAIALHLMESVSTKLVGIYHQVNDLSMKNPRKAIAQMLCAMVENQGKLQTDGTWLISAKMTHQQLADFLGLHRVTVTTTLNALKKEGVLLKRAKEVVIYDLAYLKNLVEE